jgi:hypothetical protein
VHAWTFVCRRRASITNCQGKCDPRVKPGEQKGIGNDKGVRAREEGGVEGLGTGGVLHECVRNIGGPPSKPALRDPTLTGSGSFIGRAMDPQAPAHLGADAGEMD